MTIHNSFNYISLRIKAVRLIEIKLFLIYINFFESI